MADHEAEIAPVVHELPTGYFSSEAVGRALGRRYFDMRGVQPLSADQGPGDPVATVANAFAPIQLATGPAVVLGIFIHQGSHYTALIRREGRLYYIDSLPVASGNGEFVYEFSPSLFMQYLDHFQHQAASLAAGRVGGLFRIFYTGGPVA